jgi:hypothetical protein
MCSVLHHHVDVLDPTSIGVLDASTTAAISPMAMAGESWCCWKKVANEMKRFSQTWPLPSLYNHSSEPSRTGSLALLYFGLHRVVLVLLLGQWYGTTATRFLKACNQHLLSE